MKLLIVKTSALGDIIHAFPVLNYLRQKFPHAQIDWVIEKPFAEMIQAHPYVNQVHCIHSHKWRKGIFSRETFHEMREFRKKLRQQEYDVVFDLQANIKSSCITFMAKSPIKVGYALKTVHEWPNLFVTNRRFNPPPHINIRKDILHLVQAYFNDFTSVEGQGVALKISAEQENKLKSILEPFHQKKKIMVCPGSNWKNKQITPETMIDFLKKLEQYLDCNFLFIWGTKEEKADAEGYQKLFPSSVVIDRLPLPMLQNLMSQIDLVFAMDSLPLHLAGTTSTPTFSVFGASLAEKFKPVGKKHGTLQGACPYGKTFEKRCPILRTCETGQCIRGLTGKDLFNEFHIWYAQL